MNKLSTILLFTVGSISSRSAGASARARRNGGDQPIFRVTVVERTTNAVSYRHRSGWTKVDLRGTPARSGRHRTRRRE